jgi:hypothetical protein
VPAHGQVRAIHLEHEAGPVDGVVFLLLRAAVDGAAPTEAFMTAASPGVIAHFLQNTHYPSREAYLARLVDVMRYR